MLFAVQPLKHSGTVRGKHYLQLQACGLLVRLDESRVFACSASMIMHRPHLLACLKCSLLICGVRVEAGLDLTCPTRVACLDLCTVQSVQFVLTVTASRVLPAWQSEAVTR
jgi:hypothetical protein